MAQLRARFGKPVEGAARRQRQRCRTRRSLCRGGGLDLVRRQDPKGALPGGMGLAFDWSLLAGYRGALPWGLAGGLNPTNVAEAIARTGAPLVDTSSGVESAPGVKDTDKITNFAFAVRLA
ncbi:phosphoribosylanthranilate isomerase [Providencia manganoxydans]|uniref:phosphoribosylanthranilate isomerase n=1 Tax=Providencia manganoxydans TaxID=2923283 RepID=UPI0034DCD098